MCITQTFKTYLTNPVVKIAQYFINLLGVPHRWFKHTVVAPLALLSVQLKLYITLTVRDV